MHVKRLLTICFLLLILSLQLITHSLPSAVAQSPAATESQSATLNLAGLRERVTVRRDERGIPYIEAANEADLYFAQGYVTASDRLWQMDLLRRRMRGELSEILGKAVLPEDKRLRPYGFAQLSEAMLAHTKGPVRDALEAYARGVNAYIDSHETKQLPPEFQILQYRPRAWTPADSLVIGKLFAETLSTTWDTDVMRAALADLPAEKREMLLIETSPLDVLVVGKDNVERKADSTQGRPLVPYDMKGSIGVLRELSLIRETMENSLSRVGLYMEDRAVSNNWVVSGSRTRDGKPMLANDPHLPPLVPSIWHMAHLSLPGLRIAGVTTPGAPGIILGHNEHMAWGATNLGPDVQDLYLEKFDKANPQKYQTPSGLRDAEVRREEIKVRKGFTDTQTETEFLEVTVTRHGPIIFEKDGARYALQWTALDAKASEFAAFYNLNRARNWKEFSAALSRYEGPTQNFVYADREGHIGYYSAGRIPIRQSGDGSVPYDGATDAGEWKGFIPFDQLPHVYDPPEGFIVTANQRLAGKSYPYHLTNEWPAPYRARRIYDLLQSNPKLTPNDFQNIQADTYSIPAITFVREVIKLAGDLPATPAPGDEKWRETLKLFAAWDGYTNADSRGALLAVLTRDRFRQRIVAAALGPERAKIYRWSNANSLIDKIIKERPQAWLPKEFKDYLELVRACERDAREMITQKLGADETLWTWGSYQPVRFAHPLASVPLIGQQFAINPFPQNGSLSSPNVGQFVSMRFIATPGNWDESRHGIALGVSGNPASKHFKDQLEDWRAGKPRAFPFTKDAVEKAAQETMVLMPAK
jgi:Protein related to penicillin acylase